MKNIFTWDLGATKCSAGLIGYNENNQDFTCQKKYTMKLTDVNSLDQLISQIEQGIDFTMSDADAVCIAAAGYFDGENLLLENAYPYPMHFAKVAKQRLWPVYDVIHDYAGIVCATFTSYMSQTHNLKRLNPYEMQPYGRRVAFGIGTSLGLKDGVLLPNGDFWLGKNETGHIGVSIPPLAEPHHLARHEAFMHFLQEKMELKTNQPLTFEKILSGPGTVRLYQFLYPNADAVTPEAVGNRLRQGHASEFLDAFAWYTGLFVGTMQLSFMPEGGIWITGGVALKNLEVFDRPDFFAGIQASPAYRDQREDYPLGILCNEEHALIGCAYYAAKRLLCDQL